MVKSKVGDSFAAFYKIEYGDPIDNIELDRAWNDIQSALKNLYCNTQIRNLMKESYFLKSQKAIQFRYHDENIKGIPDLICFARNKPPTIIDWKVHAEGIKGHFLQLAIYAIAMDECRNESSWREHLQNWSVEQFKLIECQLLTDENREYCLDESELSEAYDYIATSLLESKLAREGASGGKMQIDNFTTTQNPQTCVKCNFKKICWN